MANNPSAETPPSSDHEVLWSPPADALTSTCIGQFMSWLADHRQVTHTTYQGLWEWSVEELEQFWSSLWSFFDVRSHAEVDQVLTTRDIPTARWFSGAALNYAEHALGSHDNDAGAVAVVASSQTRPYVELTWGELRDQVARARAGLVHLGVRSGDRVAAYLPNVPETIVAFLATASLGAIWSSCAPEFGAAAVLDRFRQIEPKVLFVTDGYRYGTRDIERSSEVAQIQAGLPSVMATISLDYLSPGKGPIPGTTGWSQLVSFGGPLQFEPVAFDHPLYILFSSGTTGLPKPIVHGHGGMLVEHLKSLGLHHDIGPGDRFFWFSTTGWMMWNYLVSGLLLGATVVLFDGDPGFPDLSTLWRMAEEQQVTWFGVSAPFLMACRKAGLRPGMRHDLRRLRAVGSTGAPLPAEGFRWVYEAVGKDLFLSSFSGGTDVGTGFVGGCPIVPVWSGEISCRCLGARVEAFGESGASVVGREGELVLTAPMPSMPLGFWGDDDGSRYRAAYFDMYEGVWRHGDWITITDRGSCIISGRSDATLNRGGVRIGTSEFYSVVESLEGIEEALVVHLEDAEGGPGQLVLFVTVGADRLLDAELEDQIRASLRAAMSPRHVPDDIYELETIPKTATGKKLELPVKRILMGKSADAVASRESLERPEALDAVTRIAAKR